MRDDVSCGWFGCDCALTVLLERCRCVTDKTFCVCLGYDWVLWGVNVNICHILNLCTSKGIKLAMPKSSKLIVELCPCHWAVYSLVAGVADVWNLIRHCAANRRPLRGLPQAMLVWGSGGVTGWSSVTEAGALSHFVFGVLWSINLNLVLKIHVSRLCKTARITQSDIEIQNN